MIVLDSGKRHKLSAVAFGRDAGLVAAGGARAPVIWEVATGRQVHAVPLESSAATTGLSFHPARPLLYVVTETGVVDYSLDTGHCKRLVARPYFTYGAAVHPGGDRIVYGHYRDHEATHLCGHYVNCAVRSAAGNYRRVWQREPVDPPEDGWATCFAFFPDGERFAQAEVSAPGFRFSGPRVVVRSALTGDALHRIAGPCDQLAVSPRGDLLVTGLRNLVYAFDATDFTVRPRKVVTGTRRLAGIAFHPSGKYLAATSNDAMVKLYDTTTWEVAKAYTWELGRMRSVAFSPDGTLAAAGSDTGKVVVWDVDV